MFGLLFCIFWIWIIVLGFKGMIRRFQQLGTWLCTPWGSSGQYTPIARGTVGQAWEPDEYRRYSSLAAQTPVPAIPDVTREMETVLDEERRTAEQLARDIADWQEAIEGLNKAVVDWTEKAALALTKGRNDLSRAAIAERQRTQQRIRELEAEVVEMRRLLTTHASDIQNLETKLSTVYRRSHMVETRLSAAHTSARARQLLYGEQVKDALSRFEVIEAEADLAEGHAEAFALGAGQSSEMQALEAELAALRPSAGFGRKRIAP